MSYRKTHIKPKIKKLKSKPKVIFYKKIYFWAIIASVILLSVLWFVFFYSGFQLENIEVLGNDKIKTEELEKTLWQKIGLNFIKIGSFEISSKSILFINRSNLEKKILDNFKITNSAQIKKNISERKITLKITERSPYFVFCQYENNCFFADEKGIVFEKINDFPKDLILVSEKTDNYINLGKNAFSENIAEKIIRVSETLKNNFEILVKRVEITEDIILITSGGLQIHLSQGSSLEEDILKLKTLLGEEIADFARPHLEYIYLQYSDRAYYK